MFQDGLLCSTIITALLSIHGLKTARANECKEDLVKHTIENDRCKQFIPIPKKDEATFILANATCFSVCKMVSDIYKERNPSSTKQITSSGECRQTLSMKYKCMCKFSSGLFTWHSLRRTVTHFLEGLIELPD